MINLFGKSQEELEQIALQLNESKFRGSQLYDWIYKTRVKNLRDCKNLPKSFVKSLEENDYGIFYPKIITVLEDQEDHTKKFLFEFEDGERIESVFMQQPYGISACLSTQVGCNMGCTFCASGRNGKNRDLTSSEIALQLAAMEDYTGQKISHIVLMGMGEPLDNYDEVIQFIHLANNQLGIGQRRITLSTAGLVDKIKKLADEELQINLAISLHSPFQEVREKMMPVAKQNEIQKLINATNYYFDKTGRRVSFEYTVIDGINNREQDAAKLKQILSDRIYHLNLIPLNTVREDYNKNQKITQDFSEKLKAKNLKSTIRRSQGKSIEAACGQLKIKETNNN